ncbi:putative adipose-regulatory protein-domain-containing protein [Zychaea mexicana]|uniref:putative adipose-regulatory protein-domain-containing protein n=1 Tax=Zychaea mexicana TaxID=64656 RepID=UPI0022FDE8E3|nr:putative adipose-regulatory protein-domain-containing protein [Zychaea mexicana]KAI9499264.1 putative adipose-regulatory protein-domain-containing protein [Zychaea mexicana]
MSDAAFFYGTLMSPEVRSRVLCGLIATSESRIAKLETLQLRPAILKVKQHFEFATKRNSVSREHKRDLCAKIEEPGQGHKRHALKNLEYPGVVYTGRDEDQVRGILCEGLNPQDVKRLDAFEGDDNFQVVPSTPSYSDTEEQLLSGAGDRDEDDLSPTSQELVKGSGELEEPPPVEWSPAVKMVASGVKRIATPVLRVVFAPRAQRTFIKGTAIVIVLLWILLTSIAAYMTFYRQYIPKTSHTEPIYFQYHQQQEGPLGVVDLAKSQPYAPLRHEQAYDVSVTLHVPTSDVNFDLGNFMIKTWLQTGDGTSVVHSSRPAILRYQSKTQRMLHVLAKALPLLVGLTEESQVITVPLIKGYVEDKAGVILAHKLKAKDLNVGLAKHVTQAIISISTHQLQLYDANIHVVADFRGLRYYMYHRRFITALGFIVMFILIEMICAAIAWKFFGQNLWNKIHAVFEQMELEEQQRREQEELDIPEGEDEYREDRDEEDGADYRRHHEETPLAGQASSNPVDPDVPPRQH